MVENLKRGKTHAMLLPWARHFLWAKLRYGCRFYRHTCIQG